MSAFLVEIRRRARDEPGFRRWWEPVSSTSQIHKLRFTALQTVGAPSPNSIAWFVALPRCSESHPLPRLDHQQVEFCGLPEPQVRDLLMAKKQHLKSLGVRRRTIQLYRRGVSLFFDFSDSCISQFLPPMLS